MKKVAHYRRAIWVGKTPTSLSKVLADGFSKVSNEEALVFSHANEFDCVIAQRACDAEPIFLQFVVYEKGAPAPVITAATEAENIATDTTAPPDGKEFILSQLFCVVRGNDVLWTSHNSPLRESSVNLLFAELIKKLNAGNSDFVFQAKLDKDAFKKAFDDGITELDLGVGDFLPVLESLMSSGGLSGSSLLDSLIMKKPTADEMAAAADIQGKLVLRPGRRWDRPQVKQLLSTMATNVLDNHEDEFVIETKSGIRLTKKKMSVHKAYDALGTKHILNHRDCSHKLKEILATLDEAGILEE